MAKIIKKKTLDQEDSQKNNINSWKYKKAERKRWYFCYLNPIKKREINF